MREVDENNIPLYTTPMDNIIASMVALPMSTQQPTTPWRSPTPRTY
jgi:hypothetical protein